MIGHRCAADPQDHEAAFVVPVVDDALEDVGVGPFGHRGEEVPGSIRQRSATPAAPQEPAASSRPRSVSKSTPPRWVGVQEPARRAPFPPPTLTTVFVSARSVHRDDAGDGDPGSLGHGLVEDGVELGVVGEVGERVRSEEPAQVVSPVRTVALSSPTRPTPPDCRRGGRSCATSSVVGSEQLPGIRQLVAADRRLDAESEDDHRPEQPMGGAGLRACGGGHVVGAGCTAPETVGDAEVRGSEDDLGRKKPNRSCMRSARPALTVATRVRTEAPEAAFGIPDGEPA